MSYPNSEQLLRLYQGGKDDAATVLFNKYAQRLIALVRRRIAPKLSRRIDAEDVVQSAYRSFFAHAKEDQYQLTKAGDLWRLLVSIALHKLYGQVERHTARKRSVDHEEATDVGTESVKTPEPTPAEAAALLEELRLILQGLTHDERFVLTARLQGQDAAHLATVLKKSERTVRRWSASAQRKIEQGVLANGVMPANDDAPLRHTDYTMEELLAAGGMGKIYRATAKRTRATVAIKALQKRWQSDRRAVARFVQEAKLLFELRHPNIVKVEGLGRFPGGGYFIVMEFVDGSDLQSELKARLFTPDEALVMVDDVASAVGHAHKHGIIHCDLKPGNILRRENGDVLVTDFGFAFILAGHVGMASHSVGGTAGYIAPEVLSGSVPSPAADICSLGVLLSALVTGKPAGQTGDSASSRELLAPVASVLWGCLANDPNQRFETTAQLQRAITACLKRLR